MRWTEADWERVVRLGRRLRLLGRLAESVDAAGLLNNVPAAPRRHLVAEMRLSRWRTGRLLWVVERVGVALRRGGFPTVLLKGGAYLGQGLQISVGRLPSDLDILVPQSSLADAVARLGRQGWVEAAVDEHDRRYYYEWSHEVPPMHHPLHGIELDVHHNILPPISRTRVDADALLAHLRPSNWPGWLVLQPVDQVLHSAAHLFLDSEPRERVRDLVDIDGLMRHFGREDSVFWAALPARAAELGLSEPLALAVRFVQAWMHTPIPDDARRQVEEQGPDAGRRAWLQPLWRAMLEPAEPDELPGWRQTVAAQVILVRYHWHRMPLRVLVPHLTRKLGRPWRAAERAGPDGGAADA